MYTVTINGVYGFRSLRDAQHFYDFLVCHNFVGNISLESEDDVLCTFDNSEYVDSVDDFFSKLNTL